MDNWDFSKLTNGQVLRLLNNELLAGVIVQVLYTISTEIGNSIQQCDADYMTNNLIKFLDSEYKYG